MFSYYQSKQLHQPTQAVQRSIENLMVGDVIFFHCGTFFKRPTHFVVKLGDIVSMMPHYAHISSQKRDFDAHLVHVEMVVDINNNGQAVIGGATGQDKIARTKLFQDFINELPPNDVDSYDVIRPNDRNFAQSSANIFKQLISKNIKYSYSSCLMTMVPRVFKHHSTINSSSMNCQEIILNVFFETDKWMARHLGYCSGCADLKVRPQATPALTFYMLKHNSNWNYLGNFSIETPFISGPRSHMS